MRSGKCMHDLGFLLISFCLGVQKGTESALGRARSWAECRGHGTKRFEEGRTAVVSVRRVENTSALFPP